jgi:hypothetical protein
MQDLTPSRFFADLLAHRDELLPELVERARKTLDRPMPQRKRTRPVDQRISRSKLSVSGEDGRELLRGQVPRTPSRSSIISVQMADPPASPAPETARTEAASMIRPESPMAVDTTPSEALSRTALVDDGAPEDSQKALEQERPATPIEIVPTDLPATPTAVAAPLAPRPIETVAKTDHSIKDNYPVGSNEDVVLSLDKERVGFSSAGGARLSRKRPVSKDLGDQPLIDGDSTLRRTGSGEASKGVVRGPRRKPNISSFDLHA